MNNSVLPGAGCPPQYVDYLFWLAGGAPYARPEARFDGMKTVCQPLSQADGSRGDNSEGRLAAWLQKILSPVFSGGASQFEEQRSCSKKSSSPLPQNPPVASQDAVAGTSLSLDQLGARNEQLLRLAAALDRLPDEERTLMVLKHLQGRSIAEICQQTGWPKTRVVQLLYRSILSLHRLLKEPEQFASGTAG
jgi:RNA polymerase sigma-70 factor (ECF subfamily)